MTKIYRLIHSLGVLLVLSRHRAALLFMGSPLAPSCVSPLPPQSYFVRETIDSPFSPPLLVVPPYLGGITGVVLTTGLFFTASLIKDGPHTPGRGLNIAHV